MHAPLLAPSLLAGDHARLADSVRVVVAVAVLVVVVVVVSVAGA